MKTYKQLNGVMGDIRDSVYHAYDLGYTEGKNDSAEKMAALKRAANSIYGINVYSLPKDTHLIPSPSKLGMQYKCIRCNEYMIAQYLFCPWCGRAVENNIVPVINTEIEGQPNDK